MCCRNDGNDARKNEKRGQIAEIEFFSCEVAGGSSKRESEKDSKPELIVLVYSLTYFFIEADNY